VVKSFRFLLQYAWINLGAIIGFAVIVVAGCYITGVPNTPGDTGTSNLFETYYSMFPTMILLCLFLYAFALCTNNLNLGLSMGARRSDFFWAVQGILVFYAAVCWVLQMFMSALPAVANWEVRERWALLDLYSSKLWLYPLLCVIVLVLGCLGGLLIARHKVLGGLTIAAAVLVMMGATVFMLLATDTRLGDFIMETRWAWLWTALPKLLAGAAALIVVGGEIMIHHTIQRYVVR